MDYRYSKKRGSLQEAMVQQAAPSLPGLASLSQVQTQNNAPALDLAMHAQRTGAAPLPSARERGMEPDPNRGLDRTHTPTRSTFFSYIVPEGRRVLMTEADGSMQVVQGPARVWRRGRSFVNMPHYVAHPGEFLIVRYRDGRQEHLEGPAHCWFDFREHLSVTVEEVVQIGAKEAVVVYSSQEGAVSRRVVHGPATFMPEPGEWLHTFSWHGSMGGAEGYRKVPDALVFQKLWLMPDQMYHDVTEVRTSDDALLTIRLMIFFELRDVEQLLATSHDPIGDFVNAATSDVVEFLSRHDFESFKDKTDRLNRLEAYPQLTARAQQCGYRINKVVYRGYGAPPALQQMHDQAIESRTRLQLERATEQQAQELEDFKLERSLARASHQRQEDARDFDHKMAQRRRQEEADLEVRRARRDAERQLEREDAEARASIEALRDAQQRQHLAALSELGVDLTAFLTQSRADQVIELRGGSGQTPHVHLKQEH